MPARPGRRERGSSVDDERQDAQQAAIRRTIYEHKRALVQLAQIASRLSITFGTPECADDIKLFDTMLRSVWATREQFHAAFEGRKTDA